MTCDKTVDPMDLKIGSRLRRRRRLLGMTQQQLGESVGIRFQQIQKYECGANRIVATRLYQLAVALNVPVGYFFGEFQPLKAVTTEGTDAPENDHSSEFDRLSEKETLALFRVCVKLGKPARQQLLSIARLLASESVGDSSDSSEEAA